LRDPYRHYEQCANRYGQIFKMRTLDGPRVVIGNPEGAREIFGADPDQLAVWKPEAFATLLGDRSLLVLGGASHRRERKLLMPAFHRERMRDYGHTICNVAAAGCASLERGATFDMRRLTRELSLEVILRTVFGFEDPAQIAEFRAALTRYTAPIHALAIAWRPLQRRLHGLGPWASFERARAQVDALLYRHIRQRRERPSESNDILSLLLAARYEDGSRMGDPEIRDQLLTLLVAGHETTAKALAWAFYWLHRQPETLARLRAELATERGGGPEKMAALPYLEAVCHESLRLHPIVPEITRVLQKPLVVLGHEHSAGTVLSVSVIMLHRNQELYPDPERFWPERFLTRKYAPFEFVPFGGGHRRCLGAAFALYEMKLLLGTIVRGCRLQLADQREIGPGFRGVGMGPARAIRMRLAPIFDYSYR
jgi:cytochrome P450